MDKEEYMVLEHLMRDFIAERQHFSLSSIAHELEYNRVSFHQWVKGDRRLPKPKGILLETILKKYGFGND